MSDSTIIGKKVLVVEDEAPLRSAMKDVLSTEGYTVFEAETGQLGLQLALSEKPDVIILDLVMPVMDGQTMLKNLRLDEGYGKNAQVIVLSNLGVFSPESREANSGVPAFYLTKSNWDISAVLGKVKMLATIDKK